MRSHTTIRQRDAAVNVLRGRETLPRDAAEWGRAWGLTPSEAGSLVKAEEKRRRQPS